MNRIIVWQGRAAQEEGGVSARAKQKWDIGSVFLLPLEDGDSCVGQVIGREAHVLNSVVIAVFDFKGAWAGGDIPPLGLDALFSAVFVTRDLLDSGRWKVVDLRDTAGVVDAAPYESLRRSGFIGARIRGSGIVEEFANAFYGLAPWDDWYLPDYLDAFLFSADKKPTDRLVYSGRHPV